MNPITAATKDGHYARKQLFSRAGLITWSHRRRFKLAGSLVSRYQGRILLDFGCGDGTFLAKACDSAFRPVEAVGAEITESLVVDCRRRLAIIRDLTFVQVSDLRDTQWQERFDVIVCMEVLEHVTDWEPIFELWDRLLAPGGELLVSVPNETGVALMIKQAARRIAGWCGVADYPGLARYTWREFWSGVFAGSSQHISRPIHRMPGAPPFHCHKGFNWRVLKNELVKRWDLVRMFRSPLAFLPISLNSQIWFLLRRPRNDAATS
jgi:SAM-dependent methyltransferase